MKNVKAYIILIEVVFILTAFACSSNSGYAGEWETKNSKLTITEKTPKTFRVYFEHGTSTIVNDAFLADLINGELVGRGRYADVKLTIDESEKILTFDKYRYEKVN